MKMKRRKPLDEFEEIFDFLREFDEYIERHFQEEPRIGKRIKISDGKPETLIDVFEIGDEIHIVADLNGTKQDEVELYPSERQLEIRTINELNLYEKVELPAKVDIKSMRQSFKNGILQVVFKRKTA